MRVAVLAAVLAAATIASAEPKPKTRADKLFDDGRRYLTNKEYELACTAFEESERADPAIGTELNIALCYEEWGHIASAYRAFIEAERLAKLKHDNRARAAHDKVSALAPKIARLRINVTPTTDPSALFVLDRKEIDRAAFAEALLLDAGPHTLETRVPGQPVKLTTVELKNGEHKEIVIDVPTHKDSDVPVHKDNDVPAPPSVVGSPPPLFPPLSPPALAPRRAARLWGGIALVVGGAGAIGVATVVAVVARSDYNKQILACPGGSCQTRSAYDATQRDRKRATYMTFVGSGGGILAAIGVFLIATSRGEARVTPIVAPSTVGLAIGGSL